MKDKPYDTLWIDKAADETGEVHPQGTFVGVCPICLYDHGTADFQFQQLRKAVSEFNRTRCTCGVSTTLGVVHRADAPCFHFTEHVAFTCMAKKADPPEECDWPLCSCDPHAESVISALQEKNLAIVPGDLTLFPPTSKGINAALTISGLRAEIAALVHQRDEALQGGKRDVITEIAPALPTADELVKDCIRRGYANVRDDTESGMTIQDVWVLCLEIMELKKITWKY